MAGRTFLASWQLSATRSHACAMWARVTRAPWSPNVRAISKHCCARRRYSSALLATIPLPVCPLDDKRWRRQLVRSDKTQQSPAAGRPWRGFGARHAEGLSLSPIRATTVSLMSRLAIAITIPVTHAAKQKKQKIAQEHRHIVPPLPPLCSVHLDTLRHCPWFGVRLTKHHKISRACFPAASRASVWGSVAGLPIDIIR